MGMSSSQARLLTLTSRLHSIEISAQKIEAEKLRLANDSNRVYENYLNKLEQTKLVASVLGENGSMTDIDLTANVIYDYKTLQNQYSLITKDDKMLITESISNNYKNTDSLSAFLNKYGLATSVSQTIHHEDPNPTYENQKQNYENALKNWETNHEGWEQRRKNYVIDHNKWLSEKEAYNRAGELFVADHELWKQEKAQYDIDYAKWLNENPTPKKTDTTQKWWVEEDYSLANDFHEAAISGGGSDGCYGGAIKNPPNLSCYKHILAHLIEYTGTTSTKSFTNTLGTGSSTLNGGGYCDGNTLSNGKKSNDVFKEVSQQLELGIKPKDNGTFNPATLTNDYQKLISRYKTDGSLKTMKEWAIDMNYVCSNSTSINGYDASTFGNILVSFQDSLEGSLLTFKQNIFDESVTEWERSEPPALRAEPTFTGTLRAEPTFTETEPVRPNEADYINANPTLPRDEVVNHTSFTDKDKAQWYINLWYRMEGMNDTPKVTVTQVRDDATNTIKEVYSVTNINKSNTTYSTNPDWNVQENDNYIVIPDNKINDPKWLRNAVVEGYVLIQEFDKEDNKFFDTSVSVTTKINEIKDEKGVKKAEAEYEADMKKIDKKDRQYDTELAACETERNAIKEEVDTLKTVAKENVDRTFKLFS